MKTRHDYWLWHGIIRRCTNPSAKDFPRYGGAGVTVCDRWRYGDGEHSGLELFIADVGPRPSRAHSVERVDNSRGYEPSNVRWATAVEQQNNKKNNRIVFYRGTKMTAAQAWRTGGSVVSRETVVSRLKSGWDVASAVETPPKWRGGGLSGARRAE